MTICFLTKYTREGASSRYRSYQFVPLLERKGHIVDVFPFFPPGYIKSLFSGKGIPWSTVISATLGRLRRVLEVGRYDLVVVEREVVPWLPPILAKLLLAINPAVVVDYDDAVYERLAKVPFLRSKIPWLMSRCKVVIAGNRTIAEFARRFNPNTVIVPTVVDMAKYAVPAVRKNQRTEVEVVWIGTPVTAPLVLRLRNVWQRMSELYPGFVLKLIGAGDRVELPGVRLRTFPWSEETEAHLLAESDIGIMPLEDEPFQRGKCALKIIQCMAAGLPVVASPVGANCDVVDEGVTGFLPNSDDEWITSLSSLIDNPDLRLRMGESGRKRAQRLYSIEAAFPVLEATYIAAAHAHPAAVLITSE